MTLISKTEQTVGESRLTVGVNDDDLQAGYNNTSNSTHAAGGFLSFPSSASLGSMKWFSSNQGGNFASTVTNATFGQATALTYPDPGASSANIILSVVGGFNKYGVTNITAGTTQTQAGATAITSGIVVVTTGNAGDGIILPALSTALIGLRVQVINSSAAAGVIYATGTTNTNTINGTAGATGVAYAASKTLFLVAISATAWVSTLSN
jgi:hypothetical protein